MNKIVNLGVLETVLSNGLKVIHIIKKDFKSKYVSLTVNSGANHNNFIMDNKEYHLPSGIAHFLEHKIFLNEDNTDAFTKLSNMGVDANAMTSADDTTYYFITTSDLYKPLEIFINFLSTPYFPKDKVESEKGIIVSEIRMTKDNEMGNLYREIKRYLYPNSVFKDDIAGTETDVNNTTSKDLELYYEANYRYDNMLMVIIGDYDIEKTNDFLESEFAKYPKEKKDVKYIYGLKDSKIKKQEVTIRGNVSIEKFALGFRLNEIPDTFEGEIYARKIQILFDLLFSEQTPTFVKLLNKGLITDDFTAFLDSGSEYAFILIISSSFDTLKSKDAIFNILNKKDIKALDEELFIKMKKSTIGNYYLSLDKFSTLASNVTEYSLRGINYFDKIKIEDSISFKDIVELYQNIDLNNFVFVRNIKK